ncbi:hypothetical protein HU200_038503 [Digitaria exilis]|uniref:F-box domain-containing protein n=1 Tax=Digitaria exilis TaxID=1010633 RepID=A0A835BBL3_9POAL|nr:hypothetical protein HU200_038503 [Digitaria exilis]
MPDMDGWLSWRRRGQSQEDDNDSTPLPDDVLAAVFARLTDAADVLRCAATCKRWCRVVAKDAAVHARVLPPELARRRAFFGVFSQLGLPDPVPGVADAAYHRKRKSPYPISLSDGGRHDALLEHSRPVAARNGWVVLELVHASPAESLDLCVFNPMTGEIFMLPSLSGEARPRCYACALLTGDDVDEPLPTSTTVFFRVLIVYNRYRFTAFRAFSSDTSRWGTEVSRSARPKIDNVRLGRLGQSVVLGGVAYWPLRRSALAVQLDGPEPCEVTMPPWGISADQPQSLRLLGVTSGDRRQQQKLCFVDVGFDVDDRLHRAGLPCRTIFLLTSVLSTIDGQGTNMLKWVMPHGRLYIPEMMVCSSDDFNLRWFCEKSGVILFTVGQESNSPGLYALDIATHKVQKVVDGTGCGSWRNVVGYEMDAAGYLASVACY